MADHQSAISYHFASLKAAKSAVSKASQALAIAPNIGKFYHLVSVDADHLGRLYQHAIEKHEVQDRTTLEAAHLILYGNDLSGYHIDFRIFSPFIGKRLASTIEPVLQACEEDAKQPEDELALAAYPSAALSGVKLSSH